MKHPKGRKTVLQQVEVAYEHEIYELADAITECEHPEGENPLLKDPFEEYLNSMRGRIFSNPHLFRSRLSKGYHALLHELENPSIKKS